MLLTRTRWALPPHFHCDEPSSDGVKLSFGIFSSHESVLSVSWHVHRLSQFWMAPKSFGHESRTKLSRDSFLHARRPRPHHALDGFAPDWPQTDYKPQVIPWRAGAPPGLCASLGQVSEGTCAKSPREHSHFHLRHGWIGELLEGGRFRRFWSFYWRFGVLLWRNVDDFSKEFYVREYFDWWRWVGRGRGSHLLRTNLKI